MPWPQHTRWSSPSLLPLSGVTIHDSHASPNDLKGRGLGQRPEMSLLCWQLVASINFLPLTGQGMGLDGAMAIRA